MRNKQLETGLTIRHNRMLNVVRIEVYTPEEIKKENSFLKGIYKLFSLYLKA